VWDICRVVSDRFSDNSDPSATLSADADDHQPEGGHNLRNDDRAPSYLKRAAVLGKIRKAEKWNGLEPDSPSD
jgi:hypothetical protein